jgi:hypothetical protein
VDLCLLRHLQALNGSVLPFGVRKLIKDFMYEQLCGKNIHLAVKNWCKQDNSAALLQYGHISMWDVSNVTNMS